MTEVRYALVTEDDAGQRLDNYLLKTLKGVPKSHIYRVIRAGEVRVNKKRAKPDQKLIPGDSIRIPPVRTSAEKSVSPGENLAKLLTKAVLYEDQDFMVINKPAGLAVHGGSGLSLGLIEALRKLRTDLSYLELVHRLDKETSGCIVLAKKRSFLRKIQALFASREMEKLYWTVLAGNWQEKTQITVNKALQKNILKSGERMVVVHPEGKPAETRFRLLENFENACLVEAMPKTGRTHQIRVHSAYLSHPILGDKKYGMEAANAALDLKQRRLYLHARKIQFTLEEKQYSFVAELDEGFEAYLGFLRRGLLQHD